VTGAQRAKRKKIRISTIGCGSAEGSTTAIFTRSQRPDYKERTR
jgi:hypothetical protein